jgi:tetratricopeptide (TPR) repeat protein
MLIADQLRDPFAEARAFAERAHSSERRAPAEALGWYDRALATLSGEWSEMLVDVLRWKGTAHRDCGDIAEAERLYERSAEIAKEIGYRAGVAHVTNCRAIILHLRGDLIAAKVLYWEAGELAKRADDFRLLAMTERNLGSLAAMRGFPEQALSHYDESLKVAQSVNDEEGISHTLNNIALLYSHHGQSRAAEEILERVLDAARAGGDAAVECTALINLGELRLRAGHPDEAEAACLEAMTIADKRASRPHRAEALRVLGEVWFARNDIERCARALEEALLLTGGTEDALLMAEIWRAKAMLEGSRGAHGDERTALERARALFTEAGVWQQVAAVDAMLQRTS